MALTFGAAGGAVAGGLVGYNLAGLSSASSVVLEKTAATMPQPVNAVTLTGPAGPGPIIASAADDQVLEDLYLKANPSVVNIVTTSRVKTSSIFPQFPDIPGFENPFGNIPRGQAPQDFVQRGEGSGFVWDTEGRIVTNNHVVENADKITVTFFDDRSATAKVVGTDPDSDLAVIKVDPKGLDLRPLPIGNSEEMKVGQQVVAIGNPFGLEGTMTTGIISALGRSLPAGSQLVGGGSYTIPDVIQTDAAINPGNSGGPLLNMKGEVIGVNSAIESPVRANSGVGFAIPSRILKIVIPQLINSGKTQHSWLGISGMTLNPQLNEAMGLSADQRGVLVVDVTKNGPADKANLRPSTIDKTIDGEQVQVGGDIIVGIDDQKVQRFDDLLTYLAYDTKPGQDVTLSLLRDGKTEQVTVTLADRPSPQERATQQPTR
jgi:2-alkenal reductase